MSEPDLKALQEAADKIAIHQVLMTYCHGIDRCDMEMLKSAYWPDGTDDHGSFNGNAHEFAEHVIPALLDMKRTMHSVSNFLIHVDGDTATCESYCVAYHLIDGEDGNEVEMVVGGRYLDKLEKRNGEWKIFHRLYVMDWNQDRPSVCNWEDGLYGLLRTRGNRHPNDPFDSFLAG